MTRLIFQRKHNTRLVLIQCLYAYHFDNTINLQTLQEDMVNANASIIDQSTFDIEQAMLATLLDKITTDQMRLDKLIENYLSVEWSLDRIDLVIISILRAAVGEMLYYPETPEKVVIKEYIIFTEDFVNATETKFVNAILDKIAHNKE